MTAPLRKVAVKKPGTSLQNADPAVWHYGPQFKPDVVDENHAAFVTALIVAGVEMCFYPVTLYREQTEAEATAKTDDVFVAKLPAPIARNRNRQRREQLRYIGPPQRPIRLFCDRALGALFVLRHEISTAPLSHQVPPV